MPKTLAMKNAVVVHLTTGSVAALPAFTPYLALCLTTTSGNTTYTTQAEVLANEVAYAGYARVQLTSFTNTAAGVAQNGSPITFAPTPTPGTTYYAQAVFIVDSATPGTGNVKHIADITSPVTVVAGATPRIATNGLGLQED